MNTISIAFRMDVGIMVDDCSMNLIFITITMTLHVLKLQRNMIRDDVSSFFPVVFLPQILIRVGIVSAFMLVTVYFCFACVSNLEFLMVCSISFSKDFRAQNAPRWLRKARVFYILFAICF